MEPQLEAYLRWMMQPLTGIDDDEPDLADLEQRLRRARPRWFRRAACRGTDTSVFFQEKGPSHAARRVCVGCPVGAECLAYAVAGGADCFGVWGGRTARQRRPGQLDRAVGHPLSA